MTWSSCKKIWKILTWKCKFYINFINSSLTFMQLDAIACNCIKYNWELIKATIRKYRKVDLCNSMQLHLCKSMQLDAIAFIGEFL